VFDPSRIEIKYKVQKGKALPVQEIALLQSIFREVLERLDELEEQGKQAQTTRPKQA
jgi:hypothetical protein